MALTAPFGRLETPKILQTDPLTNTPEYYPLAPGALRATSGRRTPDGVRTGQGKALVQMLITINIKSVS